MWNSDSINPICSHHGEVPVYLFKISIFLSMLVRFKGPICNSAYIKLAVSLIKKLSFDLNLIRCFLLKGGVMFFFYFEQIRFSGDGVKHSVWVLWLNKRDATILFTLFNDIIKQNKAQ